MPKIAYISRDFKPDTLAVIEQAEVICEEYAAQGFVITLRQLYYQFVARGFIPNRDSEYKRLGSIVNDARLAGMIDWSHLEDRTRSLRSLSFWGSPADIIQSAAASFRVDRWKDQPRRVEVWIEKDALVGVIEGVCDANHVPYFSCRGYTSQSEMWHAAQRLIRYTRAGQTPVILHLGDHDPSGIDMTRDIEDRLALFCRGEVEIQRLALNMDQVNQFTPPPNPAKTTDARYASYIRLYGDESWELDALNPATLAGVIQTAIDAVRDQLVWSTASQQEERAKELLNKAVQLWPQVVDFLGTQQTPVVPVPGTGTGPPIISWLSDGDGDEYATWRGLDSHGMICAELFYSHTGLRWEISYGQAFEFEKLINNDDVQVAKDWVEANLDDIVAGNEVWEDGPGDGSDGEDSV